jgi:hypothetical protein
MGNPFGRWGSVVDNRAFRVARVARLNARGANARRAGARRAGVVRTSVVLKACCAGVVRMLVVLKARSGQRDRIRGVAPTERPWCRRDRVRDVVPVNARRARWCGAACGAVMRAATRNERPARRTRPCSRPLRARDRWLFDTLCVARSRRLMGIPLGRSYEYPLLQHDIVHTAKVCYSDLTSTVCVFFMLMRMYKEPLFPTLCLSCQQRPPLWEASLCAVCQAKYDQQYRWQRVQEAWPRWFIISLSDGMIGMLVGVILWAPTTGTLIAQLVGICILTAVIASLQWVVLHRHISHTLLWVILNAISLISTWLILEGAQWRTIEGIALIECVMGGFIGIAQAYLLRHQLRKPVRWIVISTLIGAIAAGGTIVAKVLIPVAPLNFISGVAIGRLIYSFLLGNALTWQAATEYQQENVV